MNLAELSSTVTSINTNGPGCYSYNDVGCTTPLNAYNQTRISGGMLPETCRSTPVGLQNLTEHLLLQYVFTSLSACSVWPHHGMLAGVQAILAAWLSICILLDACHAIHTQSCPGTSAELAEVEVCPMSVKTYDRQTNRCSSSMVATTRAQLQLSAHVHHDQKRTKRKDETGKYQSRMPR